MRNYFETEIARLNSEILQLKSSGQKSAQTLSTTSITEEITLPLEVSGGSEVTALAAWVITLDSDGLIFASLDKYYDDITKNDHGAPARSRSRKLHLFFSSPSRAIVGITFRGDNNDVISIRDQGGSVSMSAILTVTCTDNFTMERFV